MDVAEARARAESIWPEQPSIGGIDFNDQSHRDILERVFPQYIRDYDYPETLQESAELKDFHTRNSQFSWLDARALFVLLRHWKPARFIEIGSGFSTLLAADVNRRFLGGGMQITCIEPYPREFLKAGIPGVERLVEEKVQDVPAHVFQTLQSGDVLFIDSSHVAKTGSDVNHIYFNILPLLPKGVRVHIHDIFLPDDYPREWVIDENRSWNEQYVLRALLMYSNRFRIDFSCNHAHRRHAELVRQALDLPNGAAFGGGSIWIS